MRTDLAVEQFKMCGECKGIDTQTSNFGRITIERVHVLNDIGANKIGKPIGNYVTINFDKITPEDVEGDLHSAIKSELMHLMPKGETVLVAGLGNEDITPDALGPLTAQKVLATRHIQKQQMSDLGLGSLRTVASFVPGVLGQTGIEAAELITAAIKATNATAVVVIDALAAGSVERLGTTIQLTDSGISPGSGVGNSRAEISKRTVGIPVVAVGVPTVVDLSNIFEDINEDEQSQKPFMVTPRDIDLIIDYSAKAIAHAVNCALQPDISPDILLAL